MSEAAGIRVALSGAGGQIGAPFLIAVHENFGIGMIRSETMSPALKCGPQFNVIIDFPVENHPDGLVLIPHRLRTTIDIDDGKPAMPKEKAHLLISVITISIGSAMDQRISHRPDGLQIPLSPKARDPAHIDPISGERLDQNRRRNLSALARDRLARPAIRNRCERAFQRPTPAIC